MAGSGDRKGKTRPNFPAFKSTAIKTEKPKAPLKETPVLRAGPSKGSLTASVERRGGTSIAQPLVRKPTVGVKLAPLTRTPKAPVETGMSSSRRTELESELRGDAVHRIKTVQSVLANPGHKAHGPIGGLREKWLGTTLDNAKASSHLDVFASQLARVPITIGRTSAALDAPGIKKSPIGMVAGRPPEPFGRYPGYATSGANQSPTPAGMTLRQDLMPAKTDLKGRYSSGSTFSKRTWTTIHEGSHSILGTHDYRTYLPPGSKATGDLKTDARGVFKEDRKPETGRTFAQIADRNADSWAGFVMHGSEHVRNHSASVIQTAFRAFATRKKQKP